MHSYLYLDNPWGQTLKHLYIFIRNFEWIFTFAMEVTISTLLMICISSVENSIMTNQCGQNMYVDEMCFDNAFF